MQRKQLVTSKFALNTNRGSDTMSVRIVEVDTDALLGTNAYDFAVSAACIAAKRAEQEELEKIFQKASPETKDFAYAA
jgi:hypothetical protein